MDRGDWRRRADLAAAGDSRAGDRRACRQRLHRHPAQRSPRGHLLRPLYGNGAAERLPLHDPVQLEARVPLKLINFVTDHLKVNDRNGNPIEIGAVVVWRVADAAQASFNVDDYKVFVANQSDIAIRALAAHYPYDSETETSLRGNIDEIAEKLQQALQAKLAVAGIMIEETRLTHLAYASEIAMAMLKRQQAVAIFQARRYMVENALAIIDEVIRHFDAKEGMTISDDKKAELINSLLIVMTSDKESSPVINLSK